MTAPRYSLVTVGAITLFDHWLGVESLPAAGETLLIPGQVAPVLFGGQALNQAVAARRLGFSVAACFCCGDDFRTSGYEAEVADAGIGVSGVTVLAGVRSGHSYVVYDSAGRHFLIMELGASQLQGDQRFPSEVLSGAQAVVLNMPFDAYCLAAAELGREAGARVVVSGQLMTAELAIQRQLLRLCTHLSCNEAELASLRAQHGALVDDTLSGLDAYWITAGGRGVEVHERGSGPVHVEAVEVPVEVDPIGAGDTFTACATAALSEGISVVEAAKVGSVAASFVVEAWGCQTNLATRPRLAERFEAAYGEPCPLRCA